MSGPEALLVFAVAVVGLLYTYASAYSHGSRDAEEACRIPGCPCQDVVAAVRPWRQAAVDDGPVVEVLPSSRTEEWLAADRPPVDGREDY